MKSLIIIFLLSIASVAGAQVKFNGTLKKQLDSVYVLDQKYRGALTAISNPAKLASLSKIYSVQPDKLFGHLYQLQDELDTQNVIFIERIFSQYGYPGTTLVGKPTDEAAWNIIQHSTKIEQYMPLIKKAAESKELPFSLYATMLDRELRQQGKEQIYGSQLMGKKMKNGKFEMFVWPTQNPETVNERRKKAGFDLTVEENAKRLGATYRVVKMEEVK